MHFQRTFTFTAQTIIQFSFQRSQKSISRVELNFSSDEDIIILNITLSLASHNSVFSKWSLKGRGWVGGQGNIHKKSDLAQRKDGQNSFSPAQLLLAPRLLEPAGPRQQQQQHPSPYAHLTKKSGHEVGKIETGQDRIRQQQQHVCATIFCMTVLRLVPTRSNFFFLRGIFQELLRRWSCWGTRTSLSAKSTKSGCAWRHTHVCWKVGRNMNRRRPSCAHRRCSDISRRTFRFLTNWSQIHRFDTFLMTLDSFWLFGRHCRVENLPFLWLFPLVWSQALQYSTLLLCPPPSSKLWAQLFYFCWEKIKTEERNRETLACSAAIVRLRSVRARQDFGARWCARALADNSPASAAAAAAAEVRWRQKTTIESELKKRRDRTKSVQHKTTLRDGRTESNGPKCTELTGKLDRFYSKNVRRVRALKRSSLAMKWFLPEVKLDGEISEKKWIRPTRKTTTSSKLKLNLFCPTQPPPPPKKKVSPLKHSSQKLSDVTLKVWSVLCWKNDWHSSQSQIWPKKFGSSSTKV